MNNEVKQGDFHYIPTDLATDWMVWTPGLFFLGDFHLHLPVFAQRVVDAGQPRQDDGPPFDISNAEARPRAVAQWVTEDGGSVSRGMRWSSTISQDEAIFSFGLELPARAQSIEAQLIIPTISSSITRLAMR
jgi:hypothetical protein